MIKEKINTNLIVCNTLCKGRQKQEPLYAVLSFSRNGPGLLPFPHQACFQLTKRTAKEEVGHGSPFSAYTVSEYPLSAV